MSLRFFASLRFRPTNIAPLALVCCGLSGLAIPAAANAQTAAPPAATPKTPTPPATDGKNATPANDEAARKAMREERDALLKQRAQMDKRIRELDKQLLGEDFGDDPVAPNANGRVFVMPRAFFTPGAPNGNGLPPDWDQQMQKRMEEMNRILRQNLPNIQNFPNRQFFGNGLNFNGNRMWFGGMPGVKTFEFHSTNDPNHPFVFRLDGIDIDDKAFDKHLEELKKTDPEREKQLRSSRDQLREAEQKMKEGLRSLPRNSQPATPKAPVSPTVTTPGGKYI